MRIGGLEILAGVGALEPLPSDLMKELKRVEIEAALGERGTFRLYFYTERRSTLPQQFSIGTGDLHRIILQTGEDTEVEVAMDGVVATYSLSAGGEGPEVVLGGEDLTLLMDLFDQSGRPFPGLNVQARVTVILAAYALRGVTASVKPPPVPDLANPGERISHQQGTDYAYLQALARRTGYTFTLDPGPVPGASLAYWGPEPRGDRTQPDLIVRFGHPGPVEGLRLTFDALRPVMPLGTVLEPATKVALPIPVPNLSTLSPPLGPVVPPAFRRQHVSGTAKLKPAEAAGALLAEEGRTAEATIGEGTLTVSRGRRRLRPGQLVEVQGAADPFDGLYTVRRVRDTLTAECHRQDFELVRAGLGAAGGSGSPI